MAAVRVLFLVVSCCSLLAAPASAAGRRVLAFYYNWYGTPAFQQGSWKHWDECRGCTHDPKKAIQAVSPRDGRKLTVPDTGTKNHPMQLYDSNDPALILQHLKMAERAGIDAFIVSWWGRGGSEDRAFRTALDLARAARSAVKFTIYYERVPSFFVDPEGKVADDFRYLREQYAGHPSFLREQDKPVFFIYGRALGQMKPEQWAAAVARIRSQGPVLLIADRLEAGWLEIFDGLHEYNPVRQVLEKADMPARYRNTVALCRPRSKISSATVIPGYDDSNIGRSRVLVADRETGGLYRRLWEAALEAGPDWILITSFNEWHEGSEIEPSVEWGDLFLRLTGDYARKFKK